MIRLNFEYKRDQGNLEGEAAALASPLPLTSLQLAGKALLSEDKEKNQIMIVCLIFT